MEITRFLLWPLVLAGLFSCSSGGIRLPSEEFIQEVRQGLAKGEELPLAKHKLESEELWARDFMAARYALKEKNNPGLACSLFKGLAHEPRFPMSPFARIQSLESCPLTQEEVVAEWSAAAVPSWAQDRFVQASLKASERLGMLREQADYQFRMASQRRTSAEKEDDIQKAMALALKAREQATFERYKAELIRIAPRFQEGPLLQLKGEERAERDFTLAQDYERARKFSKAREIYQSIHNREDAGAKLRLKSLERLGMTYKKERDLSKFVSARKRISHYLKSLWEKSKDDSKARVKWVRSEILHARAVWTNQSTVEARPLLNKLLEETHLEHGLQAQIFSLLGNMDLESRDITSAIVNFRKAHENCLVQSELCQNISWSLGWNLYLSGNFEETQSFFNEYLSKIPNPQEQDRAFFWRAKALKRLGRTGEAEDIFEEIIEWDPLSYYALLSCRELGRSLPSLPGEGSFDPPSLPEFQWALALGEVEAAQKLLESATRKLKDANERVNYLPLYIQAHHHQAALAEYYKLPVAFRRENWKELAPYIYPRPFAQEIADSATRFAITKALYWPIMRQESGFNPYARSWADAFGVMQITPEGARLMASKFGLRYKEVQELYNPATNIMLGGAFLKDLFTQFDGQFVQGVASYNAGLRVVRRWEADRFAPNCLKEKVCPEGSYTDEAIRFVELIPYEETRTYVKLVMRNLLIYMIFEAKEGIAFPEGIFEDVRAVSTP